MGSVRNPVGPLPSSIYWRRRAVLLCLLALVVAIVVYALNSGGGGGGKGNGAPTGSHTPIATITPGPTPSGTHISGMPGGRDTAPTDSGGSSNAGADDGGSTGTQPTDGATGTASDAGASSAGDAAGGASGAGGAGASTSGGQVPVGSTLPDCAPAAVQLQLTSVRNTYSPDDTPAFQLKATNSGGTTCKLDFGPRQAVFTVTAAADNHHVWASDDCPSGGSALYQVPAHSFTTFTLRWNEKTSSPKCASPKGQQAAPGTYLVAAQLPGYGTKQASFYLSAD